MTFQFSLEQGSQSLIDGGFHPSDILSPVGPGAGLQVDHSAESLNLWPDFLTTDLDSYSRVADSLTVSDIQAGQVYLFFTVSASSIGNSGTDVDHQSQRSHQSADVFAYNAASNQTHHLLSNQQALELLPDIGSSDFNPGLPTDIIDALNVSVPSGQSFFTLEEGNDFGASGALVYTDGFMTYALPLNIGLNTDDDIDALFVLEHSDTVCFSLAPGSISLTNNAHGATYSAADVFCSVKDPVMGSFALFKSHSDLGLRFEDDVTAIAVPEPGATLSLTVGSVLLWALPRRSRLLR